MNKQEVYAFLKEKNIWHEITKHEAVYNMAELAQVDTPYPDADAKNLFVRDDKRLHYYLITVKNDKRVNLKEFRKQHETRQLTFGSEDDLMQIMGLIPGAVSPFGVWNDTEKKVKVFLDKAFLAPPALIGIHPNDNTATVWLKAQDLIDLIKEQGTEIEIIEI